MVASGSSYVLTIVVGLKLFAFLTGLDRSVGVQLRGGSGSILLLTPLVSIRLPSLTLFSTVLTGRL